MRGCIFCAHIHNIMTAGASMTVRPLRQQSLAVQGAPVRSKTDTPRAPISPRLRCQDDPMQGGCSDVTVDWVLLFRIVISILTPNLRPL